MNSNNLSLPEKPGGDDTGIRHVGFEIEYAGLSPEDSAEMLKQLLGGERKKISHFCYEVSSSKYGKFRIEIDADFLLEEKYKKYLSSIGIELDDLETESVDELLLELASSVVPCEIVMPPIPVNELDIANKIIVNLRENKARGTKDSIFYAFGLHINVEVASMEPDYLLSIIRSFSLLYHWIVQHSEVDFARRLSPYIDPYPEEYLKLIMNLEYKPSIDQLIQDYLKLVKSRNFALDMLPVFATIDKELVLGHAKEPHLIKPRPAFHYRLANSLVDDEKWSIGHEWKYWLMIEKLASNMQQLNELVEAYKKKLSSFLPFSASGWIKRIDKTLNA